jgi:hypothetical protein
MAHWLCSGSGKRDVRRLVLTREVHFEDTSKQGNQSMNFQAILNLLNALLFTICLNEFKRSRLILNPRPKALRPVSSNG